MTYVTHKKNCITYVIRSYFEKIRSYDICHTQKICAFTYVIRSYFEQIRSYDICQT